MNAIETQKYDPSLPLAFKIAATFNLRVDEVFEPDLDGSGEDQPLDPARALRIASSSSSDRE